MSSGKFLKQLVSESTIYGIANTLSKFVGVFLIPIYTRLFTPDQYGVIAILTSFLTLFNILLVLGMDNSSARWFYDTDDQKQRQTIISSWFWCQLFVSSAVAGLILIFADSITVLMFGDNEYVRLVQLMAMAFPLWTFVKVGGNLTRYQRRPMASSIYLISDTLLAVLAIIGFVVILEMGLEGIYRGRLIASFLIAIAGLYILKNWINPKAFSWQKTKEMLTFGLPLVPAGIAAWVRISSDRFIIQMFWPESEVGLFNAGFQIAAAVGIFTSAFGFAYGPFAFSIIKEESAKKVYADVFEVYALGGILLATLISLFSPALFAILTTESYFEGAKVVPWLAHSFVVYGALTIASLGPSIKKKSGPVAIAILISAGVSLGLNFLLIPRYGMEGAAIANLVSSLAALIYLFPVSQKLYRINYRFTKVMVLFIYSWLLILLNNYMLSITIYLQYGLKTVAVVSIIPIAYFLGILRPEHIVYLRQLLFSKKTYKNSTP